MRGAGSGSRVQGGGARTNGRAGGWADSTQLHPESFHSDYHVVTGEDLPGHCGEEGKYILYCSGTEKLNTLVTMGETG